MDFTWDIEQVTARVIRQLSDTTVAIQAEVGSSQYFESVKAFEVSVGSLVPYCPDHSIVTRAVPIESSHRITLIS